MMTTTPVAPVTENDHNELAGNKPCFEEPHEAIPRRAIVAFLMGLVAGLTALVLFACRTDDWLKALGSGLIFSVAAVVSGAAIGFLFGVPRPTAEVSSSAQADHSSKPQPDYHLNTNLQHISDWLTKVIIGLALTQLDAIRIGASDLFDAMAPALGGTAAGAAFAGGMTIYFSVFGFMTGWLAASLTLPLYLVRSSRLQGQT